MVWSGGASIPVGYDVSALTAVNVLTLGAAGTSNGSSVNIAWTYNPAAVNLDFLADGETLTITYPITITDEVGATDTKNLVITLTGTNDAPDITVDSGDKAAETVVETNVGLSTSGTLTVTDLDYTNTAGASVSTTVSKSGTTAGLGSDNAALFSMMTVNAGNVIANNATSGTIHWSFDSSRPATDEYFNYLASNESLVLTYTIRATDSNSTAATDDQTVTITITGTNDPPVIATIAQTNRTEQTTTNALTTNITATFSDVDLTDIGHTTQITAVAATGVTTGLTLNEAALKALISIGEVTKASGSTAGSVPMTFTVASTVFDYLAVSEVTTISYTLEVNDGDGGTHTKIFVVQITGTNDAPVVEATDVTGAVTELATEPSGNLTDSGTIAFSDVDLADVHSISAVTSSSGALGSLTSSVTTDTSNSNGLGGVTTWNYSVAASLVEYLAANETKVETFTFNVLDGHGGSIERVVSVTITGTNDAPTITGTNVTGAITESNASALTATNTLTLGDVDVTNTISTAVESVAIHSGSVTGGLTLDNAALKGLILLTNGSLANNETSKSFTWTFNSGSNTFDYLATGESLILDYTIRATDSDSTHATADKVVTITITGTNDTPTITATDVAGAVMEDTTTGDPSKLRDSGSITFTDSDTTDTSDATVALFGTATTTGQAISTTLSDALASALTISGDILDDHAGTITWNFALDNSLAQYLAAGETVTATYRITVTDDSFAGNASQTQDVTITLTGTNDAPTVTLIGNDGDTAALTETDAKLTATDTLTITDVDVTNTVTAAVHSLSTTGDVNGFDNDTLLGLLTVSPINIISNTETSDNLTWTFDSGTHFFDYLEKNETLTLAYTVRVTDSNSPTAVTADQIVAITITGSNDNPALSIAAPSSVAELANASTQDLSAITGNLVIADKDVDNTLTPSQGTPTVVWSGGNLSTAGYDVSALTAVNVLTLGAVGTSNGGNVNITWTYDPAAVNFDFLANSETLTVTYPVTITDEAGATDTKNLVITLTGTNDVPDITVESGDKAAETLTETNAGLSTSGTLSVTDLDYRNTVSGSVYSVSKSGTTTGIVLSDETLKTYLSLTSANIIDSTGQGEISWQFASGSEAFDYLAVGESLVLTYTICATDSNSTPATDDQTVTITITGTNDAPTLTALDASAYTENADPTLIDSAVVLGDVDSPNMDGGSLTVSITNNGVATDQLSILNQGSAEGQIGVSESTVSYGGAAIGTITTNGANGVNLVITFNASATLAAVDALIQRIAYKSTSEDPTQSAVTRAISFTVVDGDGVANGGHDTVTATSTLIITTLNDAPVVTTTTAALSYTENGMAVTVDSDLTLMDADDTQMASATVSISANLKDGDVLAVAGMTTGNQISDTNITVTSFNSTTGVLTLTGTDTKEHYEAVLRAVTYVNTSDNPNANNGTDPLPRTITFSVIDANSYGVGAATSVAATRTVNVTADNDAPAITGIVSNPTSVEAAGEGSGTSEQKLLSVTAVTDADFFTAGTNFGDGKITVSFTDDYVTGDVLSVANGTGSGAVKRDGNDLQYSSNGTTWTTIGTVDTTSTGEAKALIINLNTSADQTNVKALLNALSYRSTSDNPTLHNADTSRAYSITLNDGNNNNLAGGANEAPKNSATLTGTVTITPTNDAPVVDLNGITSGTANSVTWTELANTSHTMVTIVPSATLADVDNVNFTQMQLVVGNVLNGNSEVVTIGGTAFQLATNASSVDVGSFLVSYVANTGIFTIVSDGSTIATAASFQTLLQGITYNNTTDNSTNGDRTITISVTDAGHTDSATVSGAATSVVATATINVDPVNDQPVITELLSTISYSENVINTTPTLIDIAITLTDIDSANYNGGALTVSGLDSADTVALPSSSEDASGNVKWAGTNGGNVEYYNGSALTVIGTATGGVSGDFVVTFNSSATPAIAERVIESLTFANSSHNPTTSRMLTLAVNDADGGPVQSVTTTVTIVCDNDAPTMTATMLGGTYNEQNTTALQFVSGTITVGDVDENANFYNNVANAGSLTVYLDSYAVAGDMLSVLNDSDTAGHIGVSGTLATGLIISYGGTAFATTSASSGNGSDLVITFTSNSATPDAIKALLAQLRYSNSTNDDPTVKDTDVSRAFTVTLNDGGNFADDSSTDKGAKTATLNGTITITPVNDPPTLDLHTVNAGLDNASIFKELDGADTGTHAVAFSSGGTNIADMDSLNLANLKVSINNTTLQSGDQLVLGSTTIDITSTAETGEVTYNGTIFGYAIADNTTTRTVTFTSKDKAGADGGVATVEAKASYEALLDALHYNSTSDTFTDAATRVFSLTVNDGAAANATSAVATFTVTMVATNDTPTITAGAPSATLVEAGGVANSIAGTPMATITLTKGDVDGTASYDGSALSAAGWATTDGGATYTKVGTYGTATLTVATDVVSYALNNADSDTQALYASQAVSESVTIPVKDNAATPATASIVAEFHITGVNDAPTAVGTLSAVTQADSTAVSIATVSKFGDKDSNNVFTYSATGLPSALSINSTTGEISGTLAHDASQGGTGGIHSVVVTATDRESSAVTQSFSFTVTNPAPVAHADTGAVAENGTLSVSAANGVILSGSVVGGRDTDADGDTLSVIGVKAGTAADVAAVGTSNVATSLVGTYGHLTLNSDGSYSYVADTAAADVLGKNVTGTDTFSYAISDGNGGSSFSTLTVTVT
ncbi:MAG: VCBS domain-containing protein, partial [Chlorobium sp.]|nr:VCBS domain-containing protein [Chlorobium sp.]